MEGWFPKHLFYISLSPWEFYDFKRNSHGRYLWSTFGTHLSWLEPSFVLRLHHQTVYDSSPKCCLPTQYSQNRALKLYIKILIQIVRKKKLIHICTIQIKCCMVVLSSLCGRFHAPVLMKIRGHRTFPISIDRITTSKFGLVITRACRVEAYRRTGCRWKFSSCILTENRWQN